VYLARTRGVAGFEREVALKLVHAHLRADEESRMHLLEEARLAARIRHPNVVPVTEVDADSIGVFLVMEYVEGEALSGLVRLLRDQNHRLPPRLIARIMNDSLAGLHAAHELRDPQGNFIGLVHRDFSPQNILVGIEGVARLADFGVAKAASRTVRTKTGLVKGKVAYMSPEQARGHKVDRRCDVWAAGVVVWELITGRKLYDHEDDVATLLSVVTEEPPRLASVMQGVPPALDEAVAYALCSDVNNRCPSAEAFRCLLESAWDECGGMASTPELGAFVRQTVGHKLAERRALTSRGRNNTQSTTAVLGQVPAADVSAAPQLARNEAPRAPEDGTKTAISAAVPAAERVGSVRSGRFARRNIGLAAMLSVSALALGALSVALSSTPEAEPVVETTRPSVARPGVNDQPVEEPAPAAEPEPLHPAPMVREVVATEPVIITDLPRGSSSSQREARDDDDDSGMESGGRSQRKSASQRQKGQHKSKAKSSFRPSSTRIAKETAAPPRVLPLPQPSQRQQRAKAAAMGQPVPEPLNLAPDPYDSNR
jgi:serine/threonine-protein kinase